MGSLTNPEDTLAARARDGAEQNYMLLALGLGVRQGLSLCDGFAHSPRRFAQGVIYGIYLVLFAQSVKIAVQTRRSHGTFSAKVFSYSTGVMFLFATLYIGINVSRFLYAFSPRWTRESNGLLPVYYLRDYTTFQNFAPSVFMALQVWLGDALAIYRCFIVWERNWWTILLPILLLAHSVASQAVNNSVLMIYLNRPTFLTYEQVRPLVDMVYPINISQSCLTTALITLKIWRQYRVSRAAGLSSGSSGVGLLTIVRIIVESTMIFTAQQVIMCILYYLGHPAQYIFHGTIVPSIGVTFALLSIRVNDARRVPKAELSVPLTSGASASLPCTSSAATNPVNIVHPTRFRNHRRTLSETLLTSPISTTLALNERQPLRQMGASGMVRHCDLEKGDIYPDRLSGDAILAMKGTSQVLG
ncbi:hypothetical protein NMY22_g9940 [Coprinellus aureogranulatus]|nr:hypothetical protein NMY22_g9940 [Coprinellus aureogranulatus]